MIEVYININIYEAVLHISILIIASIYLISLNRYSISFLKSLTMFNLVYASTSIAVQIYIIGELHLGDIVIAVLRTSSIAVLATAIIINIFYLFAKEFICRERLRLALISLNTVVNITPALEELKQGIEVNYGNRRGVVARVKKTIVLLKSIPIIVMFTVIQMYEYTLTLLPIERCRIVETR